MIFVSVSQLKPGMVLAQDVNARNLSSTILLRTGRTLTKALIHRLEAFSLPGIYIKNGIADDVVPPPPLIKQEHKIKAMDEIQNIFSLAEQEPLAITNKELDTMRSTISHIVEDIRLADQKTVSIADLKSYDEYTYHHSLSVTVLSIAIGIDLNLSTERLNKLGLCAILHDIGKVLIPIELINKPSRLTEEEFKIVRKHALLGGKYLREHDLCDDEVYDTVIGHHEKIDGTGYPLGLAGDAIPLFSRIISIADVYDALTSNRPYRDPLPPLEAIEYIMSSCDTAFDHDMVRSFVKKVELYPVGSYVELNDGRICVVLDNRHSLRPVIRPLEDPGQILDLYNDRQLLHMVIHKSFTPRAEIDTKTRRRGAL